MTASVDPIRYLCHRSVAAEFAGQHKRAEFLSRGAFRLAAYLYRTGARK